MNKVIIGLSVLIGLAVATPSFAQQPIRAQAAPQSLGSGFHSCEAQYGPGWHLVTTPTLVTYATTVNQTRLQRVCVAYGPFGGCRLWQNQWVTVPVTTWQTVWAYQNQCIFTGVAPFPGPFGSRP